MTILSYFCQSKPVLLEILYSRKDISEYRENCKNQNKSIGFVPTMGALHAGHMSLVEEAKKNADCVIASIFVNPKQFNNPEDFINYPSSIDQDLEMLMNHGCDAVFLPSVEVMYGSDNYVPYKVELDALGDLLEGEKRPGHFDGVVEVVYLLFDLIQPDKVFFGIKDYQQVMVIEKLLQKMDTHIELFKCNTVRDPDGLAISSRNRRLSPEERITALNLYATLSDFKNSYQKEDISILKKSYIDKLNSLENTKVDYVEIVDSQTLKPLKDWNPPGKNLGILAVFVGKVRLIDNLLF